MNRQGGPEKASPVWLPQGRLHLDIVWEWSQWRYAKALPKLPIADQMISLSLSLSLSLSPPWEGIKLNQPSDFSRAVVIVTARGKTEGKIGSTDVVL
jgi:hypothetical protein